MRTQALPLGCGRALLCEVGWAAVLGLEPVKGVEGRAGSSWGWWGSRAGCRVRESGAWRRQSSERAVDSREPRPSGPPGGAALPRRSRHCRGGTAAAVGALRARAVSRGRASTARSCRPGVLPFSPRRVPCPPGATRPHVPRAVRVPLGGAQCAGVRRGRDLPGAGAQQRALVVGGSAGAQR